MVACLLVPAAVCAKVINVNSRNDLGSLAATITNAVLDGEKEIDVVFSPKTFTYKDNLLDFSNKQWPGVKLRFIGRGATLVAEGPVIANRANYERTFQPAYTYLSLGGSVLSPWGEMRQTDRLIEVVDEEQKLCRLHYDEAPEMPSTDCRNTWVHISQWYTSATYRVQRIDGGWVYFTANGLSYNSSYKCYNVNLDYGYGRRMPRFRLCNIPQTDDAINGEAAASDSASALGLPSVCIRSGVIHLPDSITYARECQATHFLRIKNSTLSSLSIEGITFLGNKESGDYLLTFSDVHTDSISLRSCAFVGLGSGALSGNNTDNIIVSNCTFTSCRRYGLLIQGGTGARILHNSFFRMGLALLNSFCIRVAATDFLISENTISDFGYGAIAVGTWWASPKPYTVSGLVEANTIFYSPQWLGNILGHSLMDSGAIYLYTQMDDVNVRGNFIHHYTGARSNRGIFCDDGALNFTIEGNIILHTPNSFSIDSRRTLSVETNPRSHTEKVNVNNTIAGNVIDGNIRFEGRNNEANCQLRRNIFLRLRPDSLQKNTLNSLSASTPSTVADFQGFSHGLLKASGATLRLLRALPTWQYFRRFVSVE